MTTPDRRHTTRSRLSPASHGDDAYPYYLGAEDVAHERAVADRVAREEVERGDLDLRRELFGLHHDNTTTSDRTTRAHPTRITFSFWHLLGLHDKGRQATENAHARATHRSLWSLSETRTHTPHISRRVVVRKTHAHTTQIMLVVVRYTRAHTAHITLVVVRNTRAHTTQITFLLLHRPPLSYRGAS